MIPVFIASYIGLAVMLGVSITAMGLFFIDADGDLFSLCYAGHLSFLLDVCSNALGYISHLFNIFVILLMLFPVIAILKALNLLHLGRTRSLP